MYPMTARVAMQKKCQLSTYRDKQQKKIMLFSNSNLFLKNPNYYKSQKESQN